MGDLRRGFKGVWIPATIWLDKRLTAQDKCIYAEIHSLDADEKGCYASNAYLAEFCGCSERKVSESIASLKKYGYIAEVGFNGRQRCLKSVIEPPLPHIDDSCEADSQNLLPCIAESATNNNSIENPSTNVEEEQYSKFPPFVVDIERVVNEWNSLTVFGIQPVTRITSTSTRYKNIQARVREYGEEAVFRAIDQIRHSSFLQGKGKGNYDWTITFDWFVKPNNFPKVLEGNYADKGNGMAKTNNPFLKLLMEEEMKNGQMGNFDDTFDPSGRLS